MIKPTSQNGIPASSRTPFICFQCALLYATRTATKRSFSHRPSRSERKRDASLSARVILREGESVKKSLDGSGSRSSCLSVPLAVELQDDVAKTTTVPPADIVRVDQKPIQRLSLEQHERTSQRVIHFDSTKQSRLPLPHRLDPRPFKQSFGNLLVQQSRIAAFSSLQEDVAPAVAAVGTFVPHANADASLGKDTKTSKKKRKSQQRKQPENQTATESGTSDANTKVHTPTASDTVTSEQSSSKANAAKAVKSSAKRRKRRKKRGIAVGGKIRKVYSLFSKVFSTPRSQSRHRLQKSRARALERGATADARKRDIKAARYGTDIATAMAARPADLAGHETFQPADLALTALDIKSQPAPRVSHGLERVLFNRGIFQLRDLHSRVYNFDPWLEKIPQIDQFDFDSLKAFVAPSEDSTLSQLAAKHSKKYIGSTSSMTDSLKHFHYLLSAFRSVDLQFLSRNFPGSAATFTPIQRLPSSIFLRWMDGMYSIDADKEYDEPNILSLTGRLLEKFLTVDKETFQRHELGDDGRSNPPPQPDAESFHYSTFGDFLMRSQLDAHDSRLPGTGIFDVKTRAVHPIRMDVKNFVSGMDYELRTLHGDLESYEREFYDLARATLLKYSLQVRMGRMDGIMIAYHNIARMFGFQYLSVPEMDQVLHSQEDPTLGDQEFLSSLHLLNKAFERITERFPQQSVRITIEARQTSTAPFMYIFAEPISEAKINEIKSGPKETEQLFQDVILATPEPDTPDTPATRYAERLAAFKAMMRGKNEEQTAALRNVEQDITSALLPKSASRAPANEDSAARIFDSDQVDTNDASPSQDENPDLLGLKLTVHSSVDGSPVMRPVNLTSDSTWSIHYDFEELPDKTVRLNYEGVLARRRKGLGDRTWDDTPGQWLQSRLDRGIERSRAWRRKRDELDARLPVRTLAEQQAQRFSRQR